MKSFISNLNIPLVLLLAYSSYFIYLIQIGIGISFPIALIFISLVLLYGYKIFMDHIKKPEPHALLEKEWKIYQEKITAEIKKLDNKITATSFSPGKTPKQATRNVW